MVIKLKGKVFWAAQRHIEWPRKCGFTFKSVRVHWLIFNMRTVCSNIDLFVCEVAGNDVEVFHGDMYVTRCVHSLLLHGDSFISPDAQMCLTDTMMSIRSIKQKNKFKSVGRTVDRSFHYNCPHEKNFYGILMNFWLDCAPIAAAATPRRPQHRLVRNFTEQITREHSLVCMHRTSIYYIANQTRMWCMNVWCVCIGIRNQFSSSIFHVHYCLQFGRFRTASIQCKSRQSKSPYQNLYSVQLHVIECSSA